MRAQFVLVFGLMACSTGSSTRGPTDLASSPRPAVPVAAPAAIEARPPELRLPTTITPIHNTVDLTILPDREDFIGVIKIDLEVTTPTSVVWLNAHEITVDDAQVLVGGELIAATPTSPVKNFLGLRVTRPLMPGPAQLVISYRGKMRRNDGGGIYTVEDRGKRYAFTQFEATEARRAFPCFDEPSFKVPWQLTIHTSRGLVALANAPVESEHDEAGEMKVVRFAPTEPLPSYLVAFAVGPFEMVDAGKTRGGAPIRIVVPEGRTADATYPVQVTRALLDRLEDYFGLPYPYKKLDLLAVPVLNLSAMENPGLITFRQHLMLTRPGERTLQTDQTYAYLAAHELAHQWFGNYVTPVWWDDTWLNESFATWMAAKVLDRWKPEWNIATEQVKARSGAIGSDSMDAARRIREPIASTNDIANAFDNITYSKGGAVLAMMEGWIGNDVFQTGVRRYLAKHAWGNATYEDFAVALSAAAGKEMRPLFDTFILQSGAPLVTMELVCRGPAQPTLKLSQRRYVPSGSTIDPQRLWHVPVCVRWGVGSATGRSCAMLDAAEGELVLNAKTCPDWVLPNAGELGYYRFLPKGELLGKLLAHASKVLTLPERVGVVGDVNALVASGDLLNSAALELVERLANDRSSHIIDASVDVIGEIERKVPDHLRPNYERLIRRLYRARALELGWRSRPGEADNTKQLRATLLWLVAGIGRDAELGRQASGLVARWFQDHRAIEPDLLGIALDIAARRGDQRLFDQIYAEARRATDRKDRARLFGSLGAFVDPKLASRAMAITLVPELDLRETIAILQRGIGDRRTREGAYEFIKAHFDELLSRLPAPYRPHLSSTFVALCDEGRRAEIDAFFRPRIEKLEGGPRIMQQALESLSLCAAARAAQAPGIAAFLQRQ